METFESEIGELVLIPSKGGVYEIVVDGDLVYSKKETGRHVAPEDVVASLRKR